MLSVERTCFKPKPFSKFYYDPSYARLTYPVVRWCPEINRYRSWYSLVHNDKASEKSDFFLLALAESDDAVNWSAAVNCGSTDYYAQKIPQVVYSGTGSVHGTHVFRDENEVNPSRRYKCAGASIPVSDQGGISEEAQHNADCLIAVSPDGIHWDECERSMKWGRSMSDTNNCLFYNPVRSVYQVLHRASMTDRRIHSTSSPDLLHWSEPELILHPDPFDPPCSQFYGMTAHCSNGIFIGILYVYHTDMNDACSWKMQGYNTMELVYSYNGSHWNRTRHTLFDPCEDPAPDAGETYVTGIELNKEEDRLLLTCQHRNTFHGDDWTEHSHGEKQKMGMVLYDIRRDGFVGLRSVGNGFLMTKPVRLISNLLEFNINAARGKVQVQLTEWNETPIPGFTFEDHIPFQGNSITYCPQWKERGVGELVGKSVRIQIRMSSACILYAIYGQFYPRHGALAQISYGNPSPI